ncbi:uncharacterized protein LOC129228485 [Uloborus diversus]|uniref:uncharacterized protein LOC129228485 n=1 Tax=Uloborus diversus TaxID=327109 RepID=UPI002409B063|nr:uncharacterized protein LOC129228485 [Uloborus diversus]
MSLKSSFRGVNQFAVSLAELATSSPWYPSGPPPNHLKSSHDEKEALKKVLPLVTFDCRRKTGYFPDAKFSCEVFHYCKPDGTRNTFHCPPHSLFNQLTMVCEEKTVHNVRLCREGSINQQKSSKTDVPRKKGVDNKPSDSLKTSPSPIFKTPFTPIVPGESIKSIMTLEELLSYMNGGHGRDKEPMFISSFQKAGSNQAKYGGKLAVSNQEKRITKPKPIETTTKLADIKPTESTSTSPLVSLISTSPTETSKSEDYEEVSAEYDAIEGRKPRKHKRVGKVFDVKKEHLPQKVHSHVSIRSASNGPSEEEVTPTEGSQNVTSPRLFSADRSRAKEFRKRRKNSNRRRRIQVESQNATETTTDGLLMTSPIPQTARQDSTDNSSQSIMAEEWQGFTKPEKVEPYTLPPLPMPDELLQPTTRSRNGNEEPRNPWQKTTQPTAEDLSTVKFGEKLSENDNHRYQPSPEQMKGQAGPVENFEIKEIPRASDISFADSLEETASGHTKSPKSDEKEIHKKSRKNKKYQETHQPTSNLEPVFDDKSHHTTAPQDLFPPPPVAQSREQQVIYSQQILDQKDTTAETLETRPETTKSPNEDAFRVTKPYVGKYQTSVKELADIEEQRWKISSGNKAQSKKVEVGSTFNMNTDIPETTTNTEFQVPPTTETPATNSVYDTKEWQKHTMAHQHLSKLMNDFFAMSASNAPGRIQLDSKNSGEQAFIPNYRIPDEDLYVGAESVRDELEDLPPELLEVVDLLTGRGEDDDLKPQGSHEIIKINGPITDAHLRKIFAEEKFDVEKPQKKSENRIFKKIVVVPEEDKDDIRDIDDISDFASLRLEPLLKKVISKEKSISVVPFKKENFRAQSPTVLSAKKVPVRVLYREHVSESRHQKVPYKPDVKIVRSQLPSPSLQVIHNGRLAQSRQMKYPMQQLQQPTVVLHPPSIYPPHPPPLRKRFPVPPYPFGGIRATPHRTRYVPRRRKRSIMSRLRRQIRHNHQHFLPYSSPVFPAYNPKFVPTFSPFKNILSRNVMHASGTHLAPFRYPGFQIPKPSYNRPHIFPQAHPRPAPVQHVTRNGHQTVIVEEVPVPIPVEVPAPSMMRPSLTGPQQPKPLNAYPPIPFRSPSSPAIQTPPLIQRPQNRFPYQNNYRHFGMPSNIRQPTLSYQHPGPFVPPLPQSFTSQGQVYALGVTSKPFAPVKQVPPRPPSNIPRKFPRPYESMDGLIDSYPNFPYFQGASTTPISNEPAVGRLMYSGYKPPKSTLGTKPPKTSLHTKKERKESSTEAKNASRSKTKPSYYSYHETQATPVREHRNNYDESKHRGNTISKPNSENTSKDTSEFKAPTQNLSTSFSTSSEEGVPRKRRPVRRRKPKPQSSTTAGTNTLNDISPTPPPPEQIPPPPAVYTTKPAQYETPEPPLSFRENNKPPETSSILYPPAGYYGKDQLGQFFDSSAKSYKKTSTPKPYQQKYLGESVASDELKDSVESFSAEYGDEPAFGTRLKSKPRTQARSKSLKARQPNPSQTQKQEVRTNPNSKLGSNQEQMKKQQYPAERNNDASLNEKSRETKNMMPPQRRRRPLPPRPRVRPANIPISQPDPGAHHFNYQETPGGFYAVPKGLQNFVAPGQRGPSSFSGSTDMFGIPHPVIDQSIYSLRPHETPIDFNPNFFSVPKHVAQQQQSPLHNMNIKPIPESARGFFTAPDPSKFQKKKSEEKETQERNPSVESANENNEQQNSATRKLRKPKRKNRYNPRVNENKENKENNHYKQSEEGNVGETTPSNYRDRTTTSSTTFEPRTTTFTASSPNDIKESSAVFKQRPPLLPKSLPEISKSLLDGKIDFQKLNASISTSVSVSGALPSPNNSEENKKVFSSQNGGLAVIKKGPKRKRIRQRMTTTTGVPFLNDNESSTNAKYEIAASVLDIIKATTETERQASGFYSNNYADEIPSASKVSSS